MPAWLKAGSAFPAGELLARRAGFRQSESLIQLAGGCGGPIVTIVTIVNRGSH